jgi:hypothetical protein
MIETSGFLASAGIGLINYPQKGYLNSFKTLLKALF